MRPSFHQLYPILALVALAGGTVWLERITRDEDPRPATEARRDPDFTAEQTRLVSFDVNGRQRYELLADRITNYPFAGITQLERPRLRYDSGGRELRISANAGAVSDSGAQVLLTGDVRAARAATAEAPAMSFASESLRVWPDDERAESRDPVVLTQGSTTARGRGLKSDNLFGTLDLLGDVTVHMPRSSRIPQ
jgi:lipopolysaccharide export system protein LptC